MGSDTTIINHNYNNSNHHNHIRTNSKILITLSDLLVKMESVDSIAEKTTNHSSSFWHTSVIFIQ